MSIVMGYKVSGIRCHIGVQIHGSVETGVSCSRSNVELSFQDGGVLIEQKKGGASFVPFSNISQVLLEKADEQEESPPKKLHAK